MVQNVLKKMGLSNKEIQVYLSCLTLGPSPVRFIAEKSGINRGTCYDILKELMDTGLVSYYHKDTHQYFIAESPEKLQDALQQKQQQLADMQSEVQQIIPQLKSLYDNAGAKPVVKMYEGSSGIKTILQDVLLAVEKIEPAGYYAYSSSEIKPHLYKAYPKFSDDRIKKKINVKVISIGPGGQERGFDERKWLSDKQSAPTYTLIYAEKVAMISVDAAGRPLGVIIEDKNLYQTQKMVFEHMWNSLK